MIGKVQSRSIREAGAKAREMGFVLDLSGVSVASAPFDDTDLSNADFRSSNLPDARMARSKMGAARLDHAILINADLSGANAQGASFVGANFKGALLNGTDLRGADLTDARNLTVDQLRKAKIDSSTQLPEYLIGKV